MRALVILVGAGCATTAASTCPLGTKLESARTDTGRAQWCRSTQQPMQALPAGRTSTNAFAMLQQPTGMPGAIEGPFTTWHANGALASHGTYTSYGARSIPHGVWAFWYPSGQRRTLGTYHRGQATGCFALWDEQGERITGQVDGDQLRVDGCTPPADDEIAILEGRAGGELGPVIGDAIVQAFVGPAGIGARNAVQLDPDPGLAVAFGLVTRKQLGPIRAGPLLGLRLSDNFNYRTYVIGAAGAVGLPRFHPRIESEVQLELGAGYMTALALKRNQLGTADLAFVSPMAGAQLSLMYVMSPLIQVVLAGRLDGWPVRDVERSVSYCELRGCLPPQAETWQIGGFAYGVSLGLRLVLR